MIALLNTLVLAVAETGTTEDEFDPSHEFELPAWIDPHRGDRHVDQQGGRMPILASIVTIALGIFTMRFRVGVAPDTRQAIGEQIYEVAQSQIAEQGCRRRRSAAGSITWRRSSSSSGP